MTCNYKVYFSFFGHNFQIEYDMDEEDTVWLELMNELRTNEGLSEVTSDQLELLMDRFEKESYFEQEKNGFEAQGSQV